MGLPKTQMTNAEFISYPPHLTQSIKLVHTHRTWHMLRSPLSTILILNLKLTWALSINHTGPSHAAVKEINTTVKDHQLSNYMYSWFLNGTYSITDKISTSNNCTFLYRNLVSKKNKKQSVVSRSSAVAKIIIITQEICELL